MPRHRIRLRVVVVAAAVSAPFAAHAQNFRDVPLGGRTATMGGAGTAFGNDSAMPYLNPAGLAGLPLDVFALSANVYVSSKRSVPGIVHPNGLGFRNEMTSESISASDLYQLPGSVMYLFNFNQPTDRVRVVAAMSLIIPSTEQSNTTGAYHASLPQIAGGVGETVSVSSSSTDYYVGPSVAVQVGKSLRVGLSAYALHTVSRLAFQRGLLYFESNGAATAEAKDVYSESHDGYSFVPILGAQYNPMSNLWIGAGVAAPSVRIRGTRELAYDFQYRQSGGGYRATATQTASSQSERPLRVNVGVGWEKPKSFALAGDVHWYAARKDAIGYQGVATFTEQRTGDVLRQYGKSTRDTVDFTSTIDVSIGGEVWIASSAAVRLGAFTNMASAVFDADPATAKPLSSTRDRYGATLGLGLTMGSFDTTLGGLYQRGKGKLVAADYTSGAGVDPQGKNAITDFTENVFMLMFSGVVTTEDAKKSVAGQVPSVDVEIKTPKAPEVPRVPEAPKVPEPPSAPAGPGGAP